MNGTETRGFFAIGIDHNKTRMNLGTLWRTANLFRSAFIFTIGARYERQASDTLQTPNSIPLFRFADVSDLLEHLPHGCPLVGVELDEGAVDLHEFRHPLRACYLLGAEDHGLAPAVTRRCHRLVRLPGGSLNVAVAGSLVIYDRWRQFRRAAAVTGPALQQEEHIHAV